MIAYSLCWGLDINIGNILFSDIVVKLTTGKKGREPNICYTRYLSLIIEHLLGKNYKNDKLKTFKPYQILATSFKKPSASEVPLISHTLKVEIISPIIQVANTQHAEEPVATANSTKSIDASKKVGEIGHQLKPADAKKETVISSLGKVDPKLNVDADRGAGSLIIDQVMTKVDSDLELMLDEEIESVS
ncbi:hypothetical protein Tco_1421624, partial [Tanacetum coccineum]